MPTVSELGRILIATRVVSAPRWQRATQGAAGKLGAILNALAAEPPEWWPNGSPDAPPGLTDYQRSVIELWVEGAADGLARQLALNQFLLLEKLGEGGQGEVYRARQLNPSRFVAVKTLTQDSEKGRRRFEQEARAMMRIQHPSVARFHLYERLRDAAGKPTDEYLIAMEFVDGTDLSRLVHTSGSVPWGFAAKWAVNILDGLAVIHKSGFIHRDIKPGNVMIVGPPPEPGSSTAASSAKLLDFGAVKPAAAEASAAGRKRVFVGTREYAPPEQWLEKVVPASDLYALGATLYLAVTGQPPYWVEGRDANAFMKAHTHAPIPEPRELVPDMPEEFAEVLRRMLAKSADERGSAAELAEEFREFLPEAERVRPVGPSPPRARPLQAAPTPIPTPKDKQASSTEHSVLHPVLAAFERVYLPPALRPPAGHEPPTPERIAALLRRPLLLLTLLVLFGVAVLLIWRASR